ncbi:unnamed protein product [Linum trigynum]|uniref:Uncharacterized protein n=1 Tax=Linum trigynum TaxID=586398 RepID=A0AAV2GC03_9ROSI
MDEENQQQGIGTSAVKAMKLYSRSSVLVLAPALATLLCFQITMAGPGDPSNRISLPTPKAILDSMGESRRGRR